MSSNEDYEMYRTEHYRYQSLHEKNLINQENATITLSIGLLAAITALGDKLITLNRTLAMLTVLSLTVTIIQIVIGYYLSNSFFSYAKRKLGENYDKSINDANVRLDDGITDNIAGKTNDFLNKSTLVTFLVGLLFFISLTAIYIA